MRVLFLLLVICVDTGLAAEAVLDFRTYIPEVLDAPAYGTDGVERLSGEAGWLAQLYVGREASALAAVGPILRFGTNVHAGYLWSSSPIKVVVPGVGVGEQLYFQVVTWVDHGHIPEDPVDYGPVSDVISLLVTETPMPLLGLRPLVYTRPAMWIVRSAKGVTLNWGRDHPFDLEESLAIGPNADWFPAAAAEVEYESVPWEVRASLLITNGHRFFRLRMAGI